MGQHLVPRLVGNVWTLAIMVPIHVLARGDAERECVQPPQEGTAQDAAEHDFFFFFNENKGERKRLVELKMARTMEEIMTNAGVVLGDLKESH